MYAHPLIHTELARQRQLELHRGAQPLRRSFLKRAQPRNNPAEGELRLLVLTARKGDPQAWESLVARFTPTLRAVVRGYRLTTADVEDVVQTTWVVTFAHIDRLRKPEAIGGWLHVTARREALRTLQRRQREIPIDELWQPDQHDHTSPESALLAAEQRDTVHAAVERLPNRRQRTIINALNHADISYADLADKLNIPVGSIGPTRDRALARLRRDRHLTALHNTGS